MAEFEVFSISSETDPDDEGIVIVFDGELDGVVAKYQLKVQGTQLYFEHASVAPSIDVESAASRLPTIESHTQIQVAPDRMTATWKVVTDQGCDITFRLAAPLLEEFAKHLEDAMAPPATH